MKHTLWYVPMIDTYDYAYCKFFKTEQEAKSFVDSREDSYDDDAEEQIIGRQPGRCFEFEVTEIGELEFNE